MTDALRQGCRGVTPLSARLEPWHRRLLSRPEVLAALLEEHGSPLNLLHPGPLGRHAAELAEAATALDVPLGIYLARKANKAIAFVDEARRLGLGVDVAGERELDQTLARGIGAERVVVTAAVKPRGLLERCVQTGVTVVLDNADETALLQEIAGSRRRDVTVALRLAPDLGAGRPPTRFGLEAAEALRMIGPARPARAPGGVVVAGVHFHLDGYLPGDRVAAIAQGLALSAGLRAAGHRTRFLDIGGGIPMSYLDHPEQWSRFWREHRRGLIDGAALTYEANGLGLMVHEGRVLGTPRVYPYAQSPVRGRWLAQVLGARAHDATGRTVAATIRDSGLELRCEPGRALLDGCGLTAARVEFRKPRRDGSWLIGLAMNRTQCRSTSDDFLVDPLLVGTGPRRGVRRAGAEMEGYLVGAYCIERELLTWRRLVFPTGVEVGDIVVFPNTAGYLMHILESASHQIPLARNVVVAAGSGFILDPIDAPGG